MRYVNLGCGSNYHPDWINIDIAPLGPGVIAHDLSRGIPLDDNSCDVVYHSHVLEHIRRSEALPFIRECHRVLRPGGIIRVAVPDLERICRVYLDKLDEAVAGDPSAAADYEWMLMEMFDQTTRERSGGGMGEYLRRQPLVNEEFIYERIGEEGRRMIDSVRRSKSGESRPGRSSLLRSLLRRVRSRLAGTLLGDDGVRALAIGRFRLEGEVHQWMYDRHSLAKLLLDAGFTSPRQRGATESAIPDWTSYNLDTLPDGSIIKPDSLFMEAGK